MENQFSDYWYKVADTTMASLKELSGIQSKALESVVDHQQAVMVGVLDAYSAQLKLLSDSKNYKDLLSGQAKLISDQSDKMLTITRDTTGTFETIKGELSSWLEKGMESSRVVAPLNLAKAVSAKKAA